MPNHFNYPEVCISGKMYIMYTAFNKTFYFENHYKLGFSNLTESSLMQFATWVFEIKKSKFDIEESFLIKTGEV